jgi:hypothetical protein
MTVDAPSLREVGPYAAAEWPPTVTPFQPSDCAGTDAMTGTLRRSPRQGDEIEGHRGNHQHAPACRYEPEPRSQRSPANPQREVVKLARRQFTSFDQRGRIGHVEDAGPVKLACAAARHRWHQRRAGHFARGLTTGRSIGPGVGRVQTRTRRRAFVISTVGAPDVHLGDGIENLVVRSAPRVPSPKLMQLARGCEPRAGAA